MHCLACTCRLLPALRILLASLLLLCLPARAELIAIPPLSGPVTDLTATLDAAQQQQLSESLLGLEMRKGSQLAVLIVPTTGEESIEQYSMRVVENWRLGRKDVDDGVLLLLAKDDRKLRIEVGYGLEGALTDASARRITSEVMVPRLREGDYFAAIVAGVEQISRVIEGEALPAPQPANDWGNDFAGLSFEALVFMLLISIVLRASIGRYLPGVLCGALTALVTAGLIWLLFAELLPTLTAALIGLIVGLLRPRTDGTGDATDYSSDSGFSSSSSASSSSFSSSSDSDSSFSGSSDGDFGGGGSSDSY